MAIHSRIEEIRNECADISRNGGRDAHVASSLAVITLADVHHPLGQMADEMGIPRNLQTIKSMISRDYQRTNFIHCSEIELVANIFDNPLKLVHDLGVGLGYNELNYFGTGSLSTTIFGAMAYARLYLSNGASSTLSPFAEGVLDASTFGDPRIADAESYGPLIVRLFDGDKVIEVIVPRDLYNVSDRLLR